MDGYFVAPPMPVTNFSHVPVAVPWGNSYYVNQSVINNFWSVRDLWLEDRWPPQSESAIAPTMTQVIPPVFVPHESVTPVVMISW
jgi:hypothetical protein